jgi:protein tyrosine/serine phosphatase
MYRQSAEQRARQIIEYNKTTVLDGITKKYAKLFKAIEDYEYISIKGTEIQEQDISIEINSLLEEVGISEDDARLMFEEYQVLVDDWKNACGENDG